MKRLFGYILLGLLAAGCSNTSPTSDALSPEALPAVAVALTGSVSGEDSATETYPERAEVTRFMSRAKVEFEAGRFDEALVICEQALGIDPHSVTASELKTRITAVLIRS